VSARMSWSPGTLGGPETFAGQATVAMRNRFARLGAPVYFPAVDGVWEALRTGAIDCAVLTAESTQTTLSDMAERLTSSPAQAFATAELAVPYRCMLLGRPGTNLDAVRTVLGHGSLNQCRAFLREELPWAEVRMHSQNSLAAAQEVLDADGSVAVVGTASSAQANGLAVLARDIDRGATGLWWLLTRAGCAVRLPDVLVFSLLSRGCGAVSRVVNRLDRSGFELRSLATVGAGELFTYRHLLVFTGPPLTDPPAELAYGIDDCRLVGAMSSSSPVLPAA
jgi:prephenate dehydratase